MPELRPNRKLDAAGRHAPEQIIVAFNERRKKFLDLIVLANELEASAKWDQELLHDRAMPGIKATIAALRKELCSYLPHVVCPNCEGQKCHECGCTGFLNAKEWAFWLAQPANSELELKRTAKWVAKRRPSVKPEKAKETW